MNKKINKNLKKALTGLLFVLMFITAFAVCALAAEKSGVCDDGYSHVKWDFNEETGVLTFVPSDGAKGLSFFQIGLVEVKEWDSFVAAYGKNAQVDMAIEEMSELTKALCKERRYELVKGTHAEAHANVIEEIADVLIMCRQLLIIFDRDEEIQAEINYKIQRLKQRLDKREEQ